MDTPLVNPTGGAGLYVHFPFCPRKCRYCSFNSRVGSSTEREEYVTALRGEIERASRHFANLRFSTVYFGGGTPTLYSPRILADLLDVLRGSFKIASTAEVTVEANPGTVDVDGMRTLGNAGVNRVSIGVQSLDDADLRWLGRAHSSRDALGAYHAARSARIRSVSMDLMRGLPGHTRESWGRMLERVGSLEPDHVSCYGLTIEEGTKLYAMQERGEFTMPDEDTEVALLEVTEEVLGRHGLRRYEVSNWARPGRESLHNVNYWYNGAYLGLGAGAWSHMGGRRWGNVPDVREYVACIARGEEPVGESEELRGWEQAAETAMLCLRLVAGFRWDDLAARVEHDQRQSLRLCLKELAGEGLVRFDNGVVGLTRRGLLLLNQVGVRLLSAHSA